MRPLVTVVDYGRSNLLSVRRALEHCGADVCFGTQPGDILRARALVLPGVGAFADGMARLRSQRLVEPLLQKAGEGTPLLGICLGMQMLLDSSTEGGFTRGLGLVEGTVSPLPETAADGAPLKVPHIGWSPLRLASGTERGLLKTPGTETRSTSSTAFRRCPAAGRTVPQRWNTAVTPSAPQCSGRM